MRENISTKSEVSPQTMMNDAKQNAQLIHNNNIKNEMHFLSTIKPHPLKIHIIVQR